MTKHPATPDDVIEASAEEIVDDDFTTEPTDHSTDLALKPAPLMAIMPAATVAMMTERRNTILSIQHQVMIKDVHYGVIPGMGDKAKPTLLKPGAELLCATFGLYPDFEDLEAPNIGLIFATSGEGVPFFMYRYRCVLSTRDGRYSVGAGIGSCNSYEKKYRYRQGQLVCPECFAPAVFKSKKADQPGFYCWDKKGGCGAKFRADDPEIIGQEVGQVDNPDIAEIINTIDKMAQKRALVAATLIAVGASEVFTQDLEDMRGSEKPHWTVGFDMSRIFAKGSDIGLSREEVLAAAGVKNLKQFPESANALFIAMKAYAAAKSQIALENDPVTHMGDEYNDAPIDKYDTH